MRCALGKCHRWMVTRPWTSLRTGLTVLRVTARAGLDVLDPTALEVAWAMLSLRAVWLLPDWLAKWRRLADETDCPDDRGPVPDGDGQTDAERGPQS